MKSNLKNEIKKLKQPRDRISVSLPKALIDKLNEIANETGAPVSTVVEAAIEMGLSK